MSAGRLKLFVGPMYAGKSAHLIAAARENRASVALKPAFDQRDGTELVSRNGAHFAARAVASWPLDARNFSHFVIDEVQFMVAPHYAGDVVADILAARDRGASVTVGGLDTDYRQEPFEVVLRLIAAADEVVRLTAWCHVCGAAARWTAKMQDTGRRLETGDCELYEARCDAHWCLPRPV